MCNFFCLKTLLHLKIFHLDALFHDTHDQTENISLRFKKIGAFFKELLQDLSAGTEKNNENSR